MFDAQDSVTINPSDPTANGTPFCADQPMPPGYTAVPAGAAPLYRPHPGGRIEKQHTYRGVTVSSLLLERTMPPQAVSVVEAMKQPVAQRICPGGIAMRGCRREISAVGVRIAEPGEDVTERIEAIDDAPCHIQMCISSGPFDAPRS